MLRPWSAMQPAASSLQNGSRLLALPGDNDGDTIRGLANVRLAIIDEAARCSDALIAAIRPMLATNRRAQLVYSVDT